MPNADEIARSCAAEARVKLPPLEAETGVRRERVGGYDRTRRANAAQRSQAPPRHGAGRRAIARRSPEKLDAGLSLQRRWQDLVEQYGYGASYKSVKRFVRGW